MSSASTPPRPAPPEPAPSFKPRTDESLRQLRALIRRRKATDRLFSFVGVGLIVASLGVLGVLIAGLFRDGTARLLATHQVKPDGSAPGFREIVGKVIPADGADAAGGWALDPVNLELRIPQSVKDVESLVDKRVAVRGDLPRSGETVMSVSSIAPLGASKPGEEVPGEPDIVGVIKDVKRFDNGGDTVAKFDPEPMRLEVVGARQAEINLAQYDGDTVAVDAGRRGRDAAKSVIKANDLSPLVGKSFFASMPSMSASRAGILPAVVGTLLVMVVTMVVAVPLGVAAGLYLEEYAPRNKITAMIEINIANLAGVPSIIWGLAGLGLFIFAVGMERSVLAAGLTLGLLVLPIVIIATREAIRAIPGTIREASVGLGATKWQTTRYHVLPYSLSGILTGSIIALSRAIGETAPLVCIGAVLFITFLPPAPVSYSVNEDTGTEAVATDEATPQKELQVRPLAWMNSKFTVVPMQIFDWVSRPQPEFHANAAAASVVLVVLTLGLNAIAIAIRYRTRKAIKW